MSGCLRVLLQLMQAEVEQLQDKVNGLHSMVVVVDENNAESGMFTVLVVLFTDDKNRQL